MMRVLSGFFAVLFFLLAASPVSPALFPPGTTMAPGCPAQDRTGSSPGSGCMGCTGIASAPESSRTGTLPSLPMPPQSGCQICTSAVSQGISGITGSLRRISGIRRIYRKNVLDNEERANIYRYISQNPGTSVTGIIRDLGMNRETLRYHLDLMQSLGKIVVRKDHGIARYFENHGKFNAVDQSLFHHVRNPTALRILLFLRESPGANQSEISRYVAVTSPTVRWYMQRFSGDGIVKGYPDGRLTRYLLTSDAIRAMDKIAEMG